MPNRPLTVRTGRRKRKRRKNVTFEQKVDAMQGAFERALKHHDRDKRILVPSAGD